MRESLAVHQMPRPLRANSVVDPIDARCPAWNRPRVSRTSREVVRQTNPRRAAHRACSAVAHLVLDAALAWLGRLSEEGDGRHVVRRWLQWIDRHLVMRALHEKEARASRLKDNEEGWRCGSNRS